MPAIDKFKNDSVIPNGYHPSPINRQSISTYKVEMSAGDIIHIPIGKSQVAVVSVENYQAGDDILIRSTIDDPYEYEGEKIVMEGNFGEQTKKLDSTANWVDTPGALDSADALNDILMIRLNTWGLKAMQFECVTGSNVLLTLSIQ